MDQELEDAAFRVAKMVQPCRIQRAPKSIVLEDRPSSFSLFTRRGERNVGSMTKESEKSSEEFFSNVFRHVHDRAREHASPEIHPLFPFVFSDAIGFDSITERIHKISPREQLTSSYEMGDLSLNLTPKPSCLVEQYGEHASKRLREMLDRPCKRGEGCYYRYYFPHVGLPGHIVLPAGVNNLLVNVLSSVSTDGAFSLLRSLEKMLNLYLGNEKQYCICIVCLLLDQRTNQFNANGDGGKVLSFTQDVDQNAFLLNVDCDNDLGFRSTEASDYLNPVVNVHEGKTVQLWDLQLNKHYSIELFDDIWLCINKKKLSQ